GDNQLTTGGGAGSVASGRPNNLPFSRAREFVGRGAALTALHARVQQAQAVAITAVQGMGGIGKSELALQYADRYSGDYGKGVCWLAVRGQDVGAQIVAFGEVQLGLTLPEEMTLADAAQWVWQQWKGRRTVEPPEQNLGLIVFDDVAEYGRVEPYLPQGELASAFQLIFTTRISRIASTVSDFSLAVLTPEDSLLLLQALVSDGRVEAELEIAKALCERVGNLPLALQLLGNYLAERRDTSLSTLQQRLGENAVAARALVKVMPGMTAKLGVAEALELSWEAVGKQDNNAQYTACFFSLFATAPIPWWMVKTQVVEVELEDFEEARNALIRLSLLHRVGENLYQVHQLIRDFLLIKLEEREEEAALKRAYCEGIVAISRKVPSAPVRELLLQLTPALPHIEEVIERWQSSLSDEDNELVAPFVALALFYGGQGAYGQAEPWCKACLLATKTRFGEEHPDVATSFNNLAWLYDSQGYYEDAEPLYLQALEQRRKLLGEEHPDVAQSLNNLATLYTNQGRYEDAEPLYLRALEQQRKLLGEEHPDVATNLHNLAGLYERQGRYEDAEPLYLRALEQQRKLLGEEHPDVTLTLNNLAWLYNCQGRYEDAKPLALQALATCRKLLGEEHPNVALSLTNLALLYESQGRYEDAEPLLLQALALCRKLLGEEHPDVAASLTNLALLYKRQGRYEDAEPLYLQALKQQRKLLGEEHPNVAASLNNLASLYESQGRYEDAEPLYLQALALYRKLLGEEHPNVATILNNLGVLYYQQNNYVQAKALFVESLAIQETKLGSKHPSTKTTKQWLEVTRFRLTIKPFCTLMTNLLRKFRR
ncbi:MAG: tetratricopeptide repeat protein, partial [Cyanobacteria bacterium J06597_16]